MARSGDRGVFFGWEKRRGLFRASRARTRQVAVGVVVLTLAVLVFRREERAAGVRATRASITTATRALFAYRADHPGACPRELSELASQGYLREAPVDAWGRPLHLVCPGRRDARGFDVWSDGPDGVYGGLDRVE